MSLLSFCFAPENELCAIAEGPSHFADELSCAKTQQEQQQYNSTKGRQLPGAHYRVRCCNDYIKLTEQINSLEDDKNHSNHIVNEQTTLIKSTLNLLKFNQNILIVRTCFC